MPGELLEAARLDGSGEVRTFFTVSTRLMAPALVTIFLFQFVAVWNNFMLPYIMLGDDNLFPDASIDAPCPTSISGKVFAPNGTLPLYNVTVYVPMSPPGPLPEGLSCGQCSTNLPGGAVASARSPGRRLEPARESQRGSAIVGWHRVVAAILEQIDQQRLVSAPVIEERVLTTTRVIEPALIQRQDAEAARQRTGRGGRARDSSNGPAVLRDQG